MYEKKLLSALTLFLLIVSGCTLSRDAYLKENFDQIRPLQETDLAIREFSDLPRLIAAAKSNDFEAVTNLLRNGEDMEKRDQYGRSALWYAFEHASFESFRILLENGASPDFPLDYGSPSDGYKKLKFYSLAREYALYNRIKDFENSNDIKIFDAYFSEFPNGRYASETEKMFKRIVERDYARMKGSDTGVRQFMKKYSDMGQNVYLRAAVPGRDRSIPAGDRFSEGGKPRAEKGRAKAPVASSQTAATETPKRIPSPEIRTLRPPCQGEGRAGSGRTECLAGKCHITSLGVFHQQVQKKQGIPFCGAAGQRRVQKNPFGNRVMGIIPKANSPGVSSPGYQEMSQAIRSGRQCC
ncbi:MAG: hypothetical protein B6245_14455 [Desulfobacteraceae bacterium 4572_88]|nr:MAG: hypothetical protein B6245_14455 [Desulfobacteraceae bacterium 4572_88]